MICVTALSMTPVKGTRLHHVDAVELTQTGARNDRRFLLIDARERMINATRLGAIQQVVADIADERLSLAFPGGEKVQGEVRTDGEVTARFYSEALHCRVLDGPWADALSDHLGERVRLVEPDEGAIDRRRDGAASLVSRSSLAALGEAGGVSEVDARRFRMLIEVDGIGAHAEDAWVGRAAQVGDARVRWGGHVGRCLITSRQPDTGEIDLPTLDILRGFRRDLDTTEPLPFGIYGAVVQEGVIRVGDPVLVS